MISIELLKHKNIILTHHKNIILTQSVNQATEYLNKKEKTNIYHIESKYPLETCVLPIIKIKILNEVNKLFKF
jgi:hypothetical protein